MLVINKRLLMLWLISEEHCSLTGGSSLLKCAVLWLVGFFVKLVRDGIVLLKNDIRRKKKLKNQKRKKKEKGGLQLWLSRVVIRLLNSCLDDICGSMEISYCWLSGIFFSFHYDHLFF